MVSLRGYYKRRSESDVSLQLLGNSLTQNLLATNLRGAVLQETSVLPVGFAEGFCHLRWAESGELTEKQAIKKSALPSVSHHFSV